MLYGLSSSNRKMWWPTVRPTMTATNRPAWYVMASSISQYANTTPTPYRRDVYRPSMRFLRWRLLISRSIKRASGVFSICTRTRYHARNSYRMAPKNVPTTANASFMRLSSTQPLKRYSTHASGLKLNPLPMTDSPMQNAPTSVCVPSPLSVELVPTPELAGGMLDEPPPGFDPAYRSGACEKSSACAVEHACIAWLPFTSTCGSPSTGTFMRHTGHCLPVFAVGIAEDAPESAPVNRLDDAGFVEDAEELLQNFIGLAAKTSRCSTMEQK
mmetsp:Transcript_4961/g.12335  ORF Transcript_4961/g.12335 Transcript_4961/m.12335 type:complete len:271 (+) Transcript_4961:296-1108(+)